MTRNGGSRTAPTSRPAATRPPQPAKTPRTWTSCSPNWTRKSTAPGCAAKSHPTGPRRHRSTRRRQDAPPLPRRKVDPRTVGKTYTTPDGKTFRPSLFLTLTCPSYGRVTCDGTPGRPGPLRLHRGRAGRAALRRAVRPVHPEPAPPSRLRPAVLRRHRTAAPPRAARAHGDPRHRLPPRTARGHRRHLPPGVVALHRGGPVRRRPAAGLGRGQRNLPGPGNRRGAAHLGPGARRHHRPGRAAARRTVREPGSTPRACWPDRGTPTGASAT